MMAGVELPRDTAKSGYHWKRADGSIIITDIAIHIAMVILKPVELVAHISIVFT